MRMVLYRQTTIYIRHLEGQFTDFVHHNIIGCTIYVRQIVAAMGVDGDAEGMNVATAGFHQYVIDTVNINK